MGGQRLCLAFQVAEEAPGVDTLGPLRLADEHGLALAAGQRDRIDLHRGRVAPPAADVDDLRAQLAGVCQPNEVTAEGSLPTVAHVVVQLASEYGGDLAAEPTPDRRAVPVEHAEPEGEEVVGDAVGAAPGPLRALGDGDHAAR